MIRTRLSEVTVRPCTAYFDSPVLDEEVQVIGDVSVWFSGMKLQAMSYRDRDSAALVDKTRDPLDQVRRRL